MPSVNSGGLVNSRLVPESAGHLGGKWFGRDFVSRHKRMIGEMF